MSGRRGIQGAAAASVCALIVGCGGKSSGGSHASAGGLPRPVYPTCGTKGFPKPRVREQTTTGQPERVWLLDYSRQTAPRPEDTTTVLVVEYPPTAGPVKLAAARDIVIAGRRVKFHTPDRKVPTFAAGWNTSRARYSVLANGSNPTTVRRFIGCLP